MADDPLRGEVLVLALDDLCGGLSAAAASALAAHLPLRQVALPDGSVAARLQLLVLRGDDVRVRAAVAAWNSPFGWLRAPVARVLLVGGVRDSEFSGRVMTAARAAIDAADAARTPWALLHVVRAPERDDELQTTDMLRDGRFPAERVARAVLAPSGALATGGAALDARLGGCIRAALAWRVDAFRAELARLEAEASPASPSAPPAAAAPLKAESVAGVAEGLAALLEAAAWQEPALAACDALAAMLAARRGSLLADLLPGGDVGADIEPRLLVSAAHGAPAAAPTGRLSRFELQQRVFARTARLLRCAGQYEELGRRGVAFVRRITTELAVSASVLQPLSPVSPDTRARRRMPHMWASAACLQLVAVLKSAHREALSAAVGSAAGAVVPAARAQALARLLGELYTLALSHLRSQAAAERVGASAVEPPAGAALEAAAGLPDTTAPLPLLQQALASEAACETLCLQLSDAAADALLAGGRPRAAGALRVAAGLQLLKHGALRRGCALLLPHCRTLAADGWQSLLAAALPALAACAAEDATARSEAVLLLLSLPPACHASATVSDALVQLLAAPGATEPATPLNCSNLLALTLPRAAFPARVSAAASAEALPVALELWSAAASTLELREVQVQLSSMPLSDKAVDSQALTCAGPDVLSLAPGRNELHITLPAHDALPGEYRVALLSARLGSSAVIVHPCRWQPRGAAAGAAACAWPPLVAAPTQNIAPAAGGPAPRPAGAVVVAAAAVPLSLLLLLPHGTLALGSTAPQWIGIRVCTGGAPLRAAALSLSGGAGVDVPAEQTALLRVRCGTSWAWDEVRMTEGTLQLPAGPLGGSAVVWVRARATCHAPLQSLEHGDAGGAAAAASATLRISAVVSYSGHGGASHSFSTTLCVPAAAPFSVFAAAKHLPGSPAAGSRAALHVRLLSQLRSPGLLRSVQLRPHPAGNTACTSQACDFRQSHSAAPLLPLPAPLAPSAEVAALFLLQPCACSSYAYLDVDLQLQPAAPPACSADECTAAGPDANEEQDGGAYALPAADPAASAAASTYRAIVRLPDAPSVRASAHVPELGRVGESLRLMWRVERLARQLPAGDVLPHAAVLSPDAAVRDAHTEAPAYEADDERDEPRGSTDAAAFSAPHAWRLRWELRAPVSHWLLLSAREGVLSLDGDDAAVQLAADCVPVASGDLPAPTLLLRWHASGATAMRGVWDDPPAAATVRVLPACQ